MRRVGAPRGRPAPYRAVERTRLGPRHAPYSPGPAVWPHPQRS